MGIWEGDCFQHSKVGEALLSLSLEYEMSDRESRSLDSIPLLPLTSGSATNPSHTCIPNLGAAKGKSQRMRVPGGEGREGLGI
jgi:hypothetical protein